MYPFVVLCIFLPEIVQASKGRKESQLFKFEGLVYRIIDARERATCKAVNASSLHPGATLKALSQVFDLHAEELFKHRSWLTNTVDLALLDQAVSSLGTLSSVLEKKGIKIHLLREKKEADYHLIYIDNRTRCTYDADKLGVIISSKAFINAAVIQVQISAWQICPWSQGSNMPGKAVRLSAGPRALPHSHKQTATIKQMHYWLIF